MTLSIANRTSLLPLKTLRCLEQYLDGTYNSIMFDVYWYDITDWTALPQSMGKTRVLKEVASIEIAHLKT